MNTQPFLNELATLTHAHRMQRMVQVGKESRTNPAWATLIEALSKGDTYERRLAITACFGSRDGVHAFRALQDASQTVRGMAIKAVALACSDEQLQVGLPAVTPSLRYKLLVHLKQQKRQVPIDTFIRYIATAQDGSLSALLSLASADVVKEYLPTITDHASQSDWSRLAKKHPAVVAEAVQAWAGQILHQDNRLKWIVNGILPSLGDSVPTLALEVVRAMARTTPLSMVALWNVVKHRPNEMVDLILEYRETLPPAYQRYAHTRYGGWRQHSAWLTIVPHLGMDRLIAMLEQYPDIGGEGGLRAVWFSKMPPAVRRTLWQRFHLAWRDTDGTVPIEIVERLPQPFRTEEARRHILMPILQTQPARLLAYAACLPWDEAKQVVAESMKAQEGETRALAWRALAGVVRYERSRLGDLLTLMQARRYEQDPVRLAMFQGLAQLPTPAFHQEHLAEVAQILKDGLDAADLSHATAQQMGELLLKLLPTYTEWAVTWLTTLARSRGQVVSYRNRITQLPDATAQRLITALLPLFNAWQKREREGPLLRFAQEIGRKLQLVPSLLELLEEMVRSASYANNRVQALWLLLREDRKRAARLIPELIRKDGSWMTQFPVYTYIHRYRQDLLTPYLGQSSYQGLFSTGKTRFVLPFTEGFVRWTPSQQSVFSRVLVEVVGDKERDTPALLTVIRQLGRLVYLRPDRLIAYASDPREPVKAAALRALGRYDSGQGVPTLMEALNDDRARYAIYALRHAVLEMPTAQARQVLNQVSPDKVTVAKEVLRLLGDLRTEAAYQDLLAWDARELHRDVRVALVRALWEHLERDETWAILQRAAQSEEYAVAAITSRIPAERLSSQGQHRLLEIVILLLNHPNVRVRQRTLERLNELPIADPKGVLVEYLEQALFSVTPDEVKVAANALFATYATRDAARLAAVMEKLLPRRQSLKLVVEIFVERVRFSPTRFIDAIHSVLSVLGVDALTVSLQVKLLMAGLAWDAMVATIVRLHDAGRLTYEALQVIQSGLPGRVNHEEQKASAAEALLGAHPMPAVRHIGLLLLNAIGNKHGWTEERIAKLEAYRRDATVLVASAAQFSFWKGETIDSPKIEEE
jgi:hypothetical protein